MGIYLNACIAEKYKNQSQKIRVMSESWVEENIYCPNCGYKKITQYANNRPVADFYCQNCEEQYELKSKNGVIGFKIVDGEFNTMIKRLASTTNPNFFFLNYDNSEMSVKNFFIIPKHFFVPAIIERRKPLSSTARRAGWTGCNILLKGIPEAGKIFYVRDKVLEEPKNVLAQWQKTLFLRKEETIDKKGWLLDVMQCIEKLEAKEFTLDAVYKFENQLSALHMNNNNIRAKIRQQLQILRDRGYLEFLGKGYYRLTMAIK